MLYIVASAPEGRGFIKYITERPTTDMRAVAIMVFSIVMGNLSRMEFPSFFRSTKIRIVTCKYEQIAVESASPAVPMYHIRVRLSMMLTITAIIALLIGVFESCIEKNALATICWEK